MSKEDSGVKVRLLSVLAAVGLAETAHADSFVNTPALRDHLATAHVCRVINMNNATPLNPVILTVNIINSSSGQIECAQTFTFTALGSAQTACFGTSVRHCQVQASSNAIADNLVVDLFLEDPSGTALAAVRGMRVPTLAPSSVSAAGIITPGLTVGGGKTLECLFANTGTATIQATATLYNDAFGALASSSQSLAPGQAGSVTAAVAPPGGVTRVAAAPTAGTAKQLRASLSVVSADLLSDSSSPVGNF